LLLSLQASSRALEQTCTSCTGQTSRSEGEPTSHDNCYDAVFNIHIRVCRVLHAALSSQLCSKRVSPCLLLL
jgi:hypothetical protein